MEVTVHYHMGSEDSHSGLQAGVESPLSTEPSSQNFIHFPIDLANSVLDIKLEKLPF